MKLIVIIATLGRRAQVGRLVRYLESQTRPPDEVIISAPDASHVDPYAGRRFPVTHVVGAPQRNFMAAWHAMLGRIEPEYILKIGCSRERAQGSPANTGPEACGRAGRPGS